MDNDVQIGPPLDGVVHSPLWSYQLKHNSFMPTHPRDSVGICAALSVATDPFDGVFIAWQMGAQVPRQSPPRPSRCTLDAGPVSASLTFGLLFFFRSDDT
jgi:hypothetical protein